jgi:hypothetical protein
VITAAAMREPDRTRTSLATSHVARMRHVVGYALTHRRLRTAIGLSVVLGLSTFMMVWLVQPWMQRRGIPVTWFGFIWAAANLWLAGMSLSSARVAATFGVPATLAGCAVLATAGYALLASMQVAWAVVFYLCFMTTRGLQTPILATVIQRDAPDEDRASVLSLNALCFRLAFVVCGPLVGALADAVGLETALAVLSACVGIAGAVALTAFARAHA